MAHLRQTLPQNLRDCDTYRNAKFLILSYNDNETDEHIRFMYSSSVQSGKVVLYRYSRPGQFRMAHAKNLAHRLAINDGAEILVNMDADNTCGPGFCEFIADQFERDDIYLRTFMVKEGSDRTPRGCNGRIVVSARAFMKAGGYDERYHEWGPDDEDFAARLKRLGYSAIGIPPQFLSGVKHGDKIRFREYPHVAAKAYAGDGVSPAHYSLTAVANGGNVGTGVVFRNSEREPIVIDPIPTRVFGIGMHKTATSSLHKALGILGMESAHWPNANWARDIWQEMNALGHSPTIERSYALSDIPIPILFRRLDSVYPGSKFILTLRPEKDWLESAEKHWSDLNPWRSSWHLSPIIDRLHQQVYGRTDFNPDVFIRRYRAHNAEVLEYFKDRPEDLLVMDFGNAAGWIELCGFLHRAIPNASFPRENRVESLASVVRDHVLNFDI